jgi:acrylyl-CoA reductase (NADPH)
VKPTETFSAMVVKEIDGQFVREIGYKTIDDLPPGDVLIRVHYSSLNYKDTLSATGHKGITRKYPHTPGIDAAGEVVASSDARWEPGAKAIVTGYDLGMNTAGGFGQFIRVPGDWVVALPDGLSLRESMILGTAGFTAALSLEKLQMAGVDPGEGEVLVTGATGGVGSLAVAMLSRVGYAVVGATGKADQHEFLDRLGASRVIGRDEIDEPSDRALLRERWHGVVDTVGGRILTGAIRSTHFGGSVTTCGMVQSPQLEMTVMPFILRGVNLLGIASGLCPMKLRLKLWGNMSGRWKPEGLESLVRPCRLEDLDGKIEAMRKGGIVGRVLVDPRN